jgi:hypothetical protein
MTPSENVIQCVKKTGSQGRNVKISNVMAYITKLRKLFYAFVNICKDDIGE